MHGFFIPELPIIQWTRGSRITGNSDGEDWMAPYVIYIKCRYIYWHTGEVSYSQRHIHCKPRKRIHNASQETLVYFLLHCTHKTAWSDGERRTQTKWRDSRNTEEVYKKNWRKIQSWRNCMAHIELGVTGSCTRTTNEDCKHILEWYSFMRIHAHVSHFSSTSSKRNHVILRVLLVIKPSSR